MKNETRLKSLLRLNRMTQQDFADWFYIKRETAWQIINGRRPLRADEIVMICERFNVSADWLLGLSDSVKPYEDGYKKGVDSATKFLECCKE